MQVVVLGLGFVGIPAAAALARAGHTVVGIDIDPERADPVGRGTSPLPTEEAELGELLAAAVRAGTLRTSTGYDAARGAEAVLVCVDTPVDPGDRTPDLRALRGALEDLAPRLGDGTLVSVESTLPPGTMEEVVTPVLEEGSGREVHRDFHLVHCPERVTAGRLLENLTRLDRVLGAETAEARRRAEAFYGDICEGRLHPASWREAELSKTVENAYRDLQLAFANQVALLCEAVGADAYRVRELVNTSPGRHMLRPGPGVGGHCLPKDTWLLAAAAPSRAPLLRAVREVNEGMAAHVATLVRGALDASGGRSQDAVVVLLGVAYKENVATWINSPALALRPLLEDEGIEVRLHDPLLAEAGDLPVAGDLKEAARGADCLVLVTAHDAYAKTDWAAVGREMREAVLVDCRGALAPAAVRAAGLHYVGLGRGTGG